MDWELIVALAIAIPFILFPAAYVWYLNIGGINALLKEAREKRLARKRTNIVDDKPPQEQEYEAALADILKRYPW